MSLSHTYMILSNLLCSMCVKVSIYTSDRKTLEGRELLYTETSQLSFRLRERTDKFPFLLQVGSA